MDETLTVFKIKGFVFWFVQGKCEMRMEKRVWLFGQAHFVFLLFPRGSLKYSLFSFTHIRIQNHSLDIPAYNGKKTIQDYLYNWHADDSCYLQIGIRQHLCDNKKIKKSKK